MSDEPAGWLITLNSSSGSGMLDFAAYLLILAY